MSDWCLLTGDYLIVGVGAVQAPRAPRLTVAKVVTEGLMHAVSHLLEVTDAVTEAMTEAGVPHRLRDV